MMNADLLTLGAPTRLLDAKHHFAFANYMSQADELGLSGLDDDEISAAQLTPILTPHCDHPYVPRRHHP